MRALIAAAYVLAGCTGEPTIAPQAAPVAIAAARAPAGPNRLTEASYEAQRACMVVEAQSIEHCGAMPGRSSELSAARKAVAAAYKQRSAYVSDCPRALAQCVWEADFDALVGISRALDPP